MSITRRSPIWKLPTAEFIALVERSDTIGEILSYFGLRNKGGNYYVVKKRAELEGVSLDKFKGNFGVGRLKASIPLEAVLVKDSLYNRVNLKKRLLKCGLLKNSCSICGMKNEWCGRELVLVLDHINGDNTDNRLSNLRMVCPNCHSQTDTFAGRKLKIVKNCSICGKHIHRKSNACRRCASSTRRKCCRPSKDELQTLLWSKPTTQIADAFGVTDGAVAKWCKSYEIKKPPRGYWQKRGYWKNPNIKT